MKANQLYESLSISVISDQCFQNSMFKKELILFEIKIIIYFILVKYN
jgi:hypothetical protein